MTDLGASNTGEEPTRFKLFPYWERARSVMVFWVLVLFAYGVLKKDLITDPTLRTLLDILLAAFVVLSALSIWRTHRTELRLWPDRIESFNGFWTRRMRRSDVEGFRRVLFFEDISLISTVPRAKKIYVPARVVRDPASGGWFDGLADLGAKERMP